MGTGKIGKKGAYYLGGCVMAVALCGLYLVTEDSKWLVWPLSTVIGVCIGVVYLVPYSMLPDVIEADELRTGQRREGIFFGFFTIFLKLAVTLALTITNMILEAVD